MLGHQRRVASTAGFSALTIHSSRHRFAARLNSGVSAQKKQISAKSFLDKRHKSFSDPLSPALRHISDLIHLRAVSDLLAPGNLSHPRHRANSQLQRANNSFKPTPLRGVVVTSSHPSVPASATLPQRRGLIQALCAAVEESLAGPRPSATTGRRAGPRGGDSLRSAIASVALSPKLARAKAGNAAAVCHRLTRRILASHPFSP